MLKKTSILILAVVTYLAVMACKSALLGPVYPISKFKKYDCIVIAQVNRAVHDDQGYQPLQTFEITISKCLKGGLEPGAQISGKAKKEQARAVCPVHLDEQSDYLLLLTKSSEGYELSRFSFPVNENHQYFDAYIQQIEGILEEHK